MVALKRSCLSASWRFFVGTIAWSLTLFLFVRVFAPFSDLTPFLTIPLFALLYFAVIFAVTAIHELGHAAAARLLQWDVREIAVGVIVYRPPSNSWTWSWDRDGSLEHEDYAGWVFAIPKHRNQRGAGELLFGAGGAIASALCGIALIAIGTTTNSIETDWARAIVALGGIFVVDAVANLIPSSRGDFAKSDGMRLLELASDNDHSFRSEALLRVLACQEDDKPIPSEDFDLLNQLRTSATHLDEPTLLVMMAAYFRTGRLQEYKETILAYRAFEGSLSDTMKSELAFAIAVIDRDAAAAEEVLSDLQPDTKRTSISYKRAMATIHYVAGRQTEAEETVSDLRKTSGFHPDRDDEALLTAIVMKKELPRFPVEQI